MGLNETYTTIRGVLMTQKPISKQGDLYPIIKQEEQQRSHTAPNTEISTALLANNEGPYRPPKPEIRERPFCTHCKRYGHIAEKCYQINGYPEKHAFSNNHNGDSSLNLKRPNIPYNQGSNYTRRENKSYFNRGYNENRQNSKANNTYAKEEQDSHQHYEEQNEQFKSNNNYEE